MWPAPIWLLMEELRKHPEVHLNRPYLTDYDKDYVPSHHSDLSKTDWALIRPCDTVLPVFWEFSSPGRSIPKSPIYCKGLGELVILKPRVSEASFGVVVSQRNALHISNIPLAFAWLCKRERAAKALYFMSVHSLLVTALPDDGHESPIHVTRSNLWCVIQTYSRTAMNRRIGTQFT